MRAAHTNFVDEEEEACGRQAVDEGVEQGLGLRINPMQVLKDQQQRLHLTFAQQETLERLDRALTPLRWLELQEGTVVRQDVQQGQQRRDHRLEGLVQRQHLAGDLGPASAKHVSEPS